MNVELRCSELRRTIERMNLYWRDHNGRLWSLHFSSTFCCRVLLQFLPESSCRRRIKINSLLVVVEQLRGLQTILVEGCKTRREEMIEFDIVLSFIIIIK